MPSTGLLAPSSVTSIASADEAWINPTNIIGNDAVVAECVLTGDGDSEYLAATNFGFTIPSGRSIEGVVVEVDLFDIIGVDPAVTVYLTKDGSTISGSGQTMSAAGIQSLGTSTFLWGTTLTEAEVEASTFGVLCVLNGQTDDYGAIDYLMVNVHYSDVVIADEPSTLRVASSGLRW